MKYHHKISLHRRRRFLKRIFLVLIVLVFIVGLIVILIRLDAYLQNRVNTPESTTTGQTSAYFAPDNKVFTSQYFQFQAENNWVEIPSESSDNLFVYWAMKGSIIEEEVKIYVDNIPGDLTATRLLPVELPDNKEQLLPGIVSDHCNKASDNLNIDEKIVTFKGVKLNCDVDNTDFSVLIGLAGGSTRVKLKRPDGSNATYSILYRNVKAVPDASKFLQIIESFQTR